MNAYEFGYDGLALGGVLVIAGNTEEKALDAAQQYLYLTNQSQSIIDSLYLQCTTKIQKNFVIYDWNGDY